MNRDDTPESAGEREAQKPSIPRNIEVLIKKASVDPKFRRLLLDKRAEAAREINLDLSQVEIDMLTAIPLEQLEQIIQNTKVPPEQKKIFSGSNGTIMLAVVAGAVIFISMTSSLGHTLTVDQRDHILRQQRQAELKRLLDPNEVNEPEIEEEQK